MKKILVYLVSLVLFMAGGISLCGCVPQIDDGKIDVVCTIFPQYDWAKEIIGDKPNYNVTLLADGVDMHSYSQKISPLDIIKIQTADLFIYVGGESDEWVDKILLNKQNRDMKVINLMEVLGDKVKQEELKEGMTEYEQEQEDEVELDEHVWLSLKNAQLFVSKIAEILGQIDSNNAEFFVSCATTYNAKLSTLDLQYQSAVDNGSKTTLLFGDRFPFRYLVDDYNLDYFAAFPGCSAETEASFATITFLANKVDELNLRVILKTESPNNEIATSIKNATTSKDQEILSLDSMQSIRLSDNKTYLDIMTSNLSVFSQSLR